MVSPGALHIVRVYVGLTALFIGVMQLQVTRCGLRGLSLARGNRVAGHLLGAALLGGGLVAAVAPPLWLVATCALPAVVTAMALLAVLSSWINPDLAPPDARMPGSADPWTCERVWFSDNGLRTPALYLRPSQPSGAAVCWVHGTGDDKAQYKWPLVRALTRRGIGVLTFDLPGHGEHPRSFSLPGALTVVRSALTYLAGRLDVDEGRVGLMGISLGGALAIRALAEAGAAGPRPAAICLLQTPCALWLGPVLYAREAFGVAALPALAFFADTSVANLWRAYRHHPRPRFGQPIEWVFDDLAASRYIACLPQVPLLLIYGRRDPIAPPWHGRRLFSRTRGPKEWRLVRGTSHLSLIFATQTRETVGEWFARTLGLSADLAAGGSAERQAAYTPSQQNDS
ncbi:MAG: alpha/beta hydrolase [Anaerolineae bacterium]